MNNYGRGKSGGQNRRDKHAEDREFLQKAQQELSLCLSDEKALADAVMPGGAIEKVVNSKKYTVNSTQIRKFFDSVKSIQREGSVDSKRIKLALLIPKIKYNVGRNVFNKGMGSILEHLIITLNKISAEEFDRSLSNFVRLFEAIIAYSKFRESGSNR